MNRPSEKAITLVNEIDVGFTLHFSWCVSSKCTTGYNTDISSPEHNVDIPFPGYPCTCQPSYYTAPPIIGNRIIQLKKRQESIYDYLSDDYLCLFDVKLNKKTQ